MKNYNYAMIGNCTSAALISSDCSIDWLCMPFFDSPSVFAKILDKDQGGFFKITAEKLVSMHVKYIPQTPILYTVFTTEDGVFEVRDYMPRFVVDSKEYYCPSEIHRDVLVVKGKPKIKIELKPKLNYALSEPTFLFQKDYLKIISQKGEYNSFYLYSDLDYKKIANGEALELDRSAYMILSYHEKLTAINKEKVFLEYEKTKTYWLDWVYRSHLPQKNRELMIRSAITLKLLTFQRTGAVIAAPTTSLPEIIGGERNWDYRYCWVRDASMIVDLYARIGHMKSATRYMNFILNRMLLKHENIAVMYGINGERDLIEKSLEHLAGYENSKPVRIGNEAYIQKQNDLYGQLIEAIYTFFVINKLTRFQIDEEIWTVVRSLVKQVIASWKEPDNGIWEFRNGKQHYVHSKLMNWVAMDRAAKIAKCIGKPKYIDEWLEIADEIKEDIITHGWNDNVRSFTMYYGAESLDAANLLMLHYGFLSPQDPRMKSTVEQTYQHLVKNDFTFRYISADDFGSPENAFLVCNFWMINALYLIGQKDKAKAMFDKIINCANEYGLYAEDIEIKTQRLTGNFPQGYSHLALIQTAFLLETEYNWSDSAKATE